MEASVLFYQPDWREPQLLAIAPPPLACPCPTWRRGLPLALAYTDFSPGAMVRTARKFSAGT